jgi:hypothetical protein
LPFYAVRHPVRVAAWSVIAYPVKRRTPTHGAGVSTTPSALNALQCGSA